jgi:hypothetical protein
MGQKKNGNSVTYSLAETEELDTLLDSERLAKTE